MVCLQWGKSGEGEVIPEFQLLHLCQQDQQCHGVQEGQQVQVHLRLLALLFLHQGQVGLEYQWARISLDTSVSFVF